MNVTITILEMAKIMLTTMGKMVTMRNHHGILVINDRNGRDTNNTRGGKNNDSII